MSYRRFDELKARIGLGSAETGALAALRLDAADAMHHAIGGLRKHHVLPASFAGPSMSLDHPDRIWSRWIVDALAGPHTPLYARRRQEVGRRHADLALPQYLVDMVIEAVEEHLTQTAERVYEQDVDRRRAARRAIRKICHLDMALVRGGYQRRRTELTGQRYRRERSRLEDELTVHQEFAKTLLDSIAVGVMAFDDRGAVTSINPRMCELLGYAADEIADRQAWLEQAFPAHEDRQEAELYFVAAASHDTPADKILLNVRRGDGVRRLIEFWTTPVIADDRHRGAVTVALDVTDRQRLEQQLIRAERLAAIGELAASLAHEVRNPLAGIKGAIQVLHAGLGTEDARRYILDEVLHQIGRLDSTMRDLLIYSRPHPLELRRARIEPVIDRVLTVVAGGANFARMRIIKDYSPDIPDIDIDPDQIEQVCMNIILNAAQATDAGGRLTIDVHSEGGQVVMAFADNGPGVAPHEARRVFEPFFTTKSRGTGLGLPICRRIVEAHGGAIEFQSQPGRGARVTVSLPIRQNGPQRRLRRDDDTASVPSFV